MTRALQRAGLLAVLAAALTIACGPKTVPIASRPAGATIVLLPDAGDGSVGRARVSNAAASVDLKAERDATQVVGTQSPGPVRTMSKDEVQRMFGKALSALPDPPQRFILHFRFGSDDLTAEALALVPQILRAAKAQSDPDIVVVGHTDTAGTSRLNFDLGLKRARFVRDLLVAAGMRESAIEVFSHGETDLMLSTPDDTPESRNRRVDIAIR
jgi:outer membrane protein OmpA-like peptidoglycan-associated protein